MIISRTPLRMSFVGGGTDLPAFYRQHAGAVVSTAIDKYVYVTLNKKFDDKIRVSYSKTENVESVADIEHPIVREVLRLYDVTGGLEITSVADVPSKGTGLGSSSSFTVGLLNALRAYLGMTSSAKVLGALASRVEIDILKEPIGKQDQYAAAFGGLNLIEFHPDEGVTVQRLVCKPDTVREMEESCLVLYTGITRSASGVLKAQSERTSGEAKTVEVLKMMAGLARDLADRIGRNDLGDFGEILHENWVLKKSLTGDISTSQIDEWYERGLKAGARGGKLLGAGSGGFLMFYAPKERHGQICEALWELRKVAFGGERQGSGIIFVH